MPVLIPADLYTAGRYKIDLSPLDQIAKQRQAEKKAAREAAAKYFTSLKDKINTAGVRTVDLQGGLQDKINNWVNSGVANMGKISKGGQSYSDFTKQYQGILSDIERSKNRAKFETDLGKAQFEGKYDPDADDLQVLSKIGKSIYDPGSYKEDGVSEYTYGDIPSAVPAFDPNKQTQFFTAAFGKSKPTYREDKARVDNITGTVFVPKEYNDNDVKQISDNALNVFYGDKSAQKYYKDQLANKNWLTSANDAYQSIYGSKNPDGSDNIVNSPEKAAQADAIMRARLSGEEVEVKDPNYAQKLKKDLVELRAKQRKATASTRRAKSPGKSIGQLYAEVAQNVNGEKRVFTDDIQLDDDIFIRKSKINPFKDSDGNEYYKINTDGSWQGKNGTINKERILDIKPKKTTGVISPNAPGSDIAISDYPENIQRGIVAFSEKNNLPLNDALDILKKQRPEIFS